MMIYTQQSGLVEISTVLEWCVIPFIIPEFYKNGSGPFFNKKTQENMPIKIKEINKKNIIFVVKI